MSEAASSGGGGQKTSKKRECTGVILNKLTSVFYASVLLLIMNFVITLSK